jgi:ABC-type antimicrobial peptide transport system permease subunit
MRLRAGMMGTLGGTALVLSALGLYGVVAYLVTRRSREIGIRLALGASRPDVISVIFADAGRLVAAGMSAGVVLSLAVCPLLANHLYGLTPNHPGVLAASCAILSMVAFAAVIAPASRALRIEPLIMLRQD